MGFRMYSICHSRLLLVSLIAFTEVSFFVQFKLREKLSPMTYYSTTTLFPCSKDGACRFSRNVFKMLLEYYVAAIKPAACVHRLLSSPAHVCAVASPLLQPRAHVSDLHVSHIGESLNYTQWADAHQSFFHLQVDTLIIERWIWLIFYNPLPADLQMDSLMVLMCFCLFFLVSLMLEPCWMMVIVNVNVLYLYSPLQQSISVYQRALQQIINKEKNK